MCTINAVVGLVESGCVVLINALLGSGGRRVDHGWILGTDTPNQYNNPHPHVFTPQRRVREALDSEQKKKEAYIAEMKEQGYNLGAVGVSTRVFVCWVCACVGSHRR